MSRGYYNLAYTVTEREQSRDRQEEAESQLWDAPAIAESLNAELVAMEGLLPLSQNEPRMVKGWQLRLRGGDGQTRLQLFPRTKNSWVPKTAIAHSVGSYAELVGLDEATLSDRDVLFTRRNEEHLIELSVTDQGEISFWRSPRSPGERPGIRPEPSNASQDTSPPNRRETRLSGDSTASDNASDDDLPRRIAEQEDITQQVFTPPSEEQDIDVITRAIEASRFQMRGHPQEPPEDIKGFGTILGEDVEPAEPTKPEKEQTITLTGNLGRLPTFRMGTDGVLRATFSVAEHPDPNTTVWHTVRMSRWRAENLRKRFEAGKLTKGMPVEIIGYPKEKTVIKDGQPVTRKWITGLAVRDKH